jgi:hypothetical protein
MSEDEQHIRCMFAAFALQGLLAGKSVDDIDNDHFISFIAEASFDIADAMMEVKNASSRH